MSLYVSERVGNEIVLKKYAPAVPVYRGFWAVVIGGFAGTLVECNGSMRYIGSNEKTIYQIVEPGTYTFTATRHGETKSKTIVLDDKDPNNSYTINLGLYIGMQYLEYIESTGTQYIDTGISGNNDNLKIECEFIITEMANPWNTVYGNYIDENSNSFRLIIDGNNHIGYFSSNTKAGNSKVSYNFQIGTKYTIESSYLKAIINDKTYPYDEKVIGRENNQTIWLFNSLSMSTGIGIKLYSFKIYDNDVLVRDFVPIKDDTKRGALYDKVTQEIFYNSGEGEFICGPNKPYTRIQYIESTGTQWIDTGILLNQDSGAEVDFQFTRRQGSMEHNFILGSRNTGPSNAFYFAGYSNANYFAWGYNDQPNNLVTSDLQRHIMKRDKDKAYFDGNLIATQTKASFTTPGTAYLFACRQNNQPYLPGEIKMYSAKIWNNDKLVRDMIPVLDYDGTPCMLDQVNDRLYYNDGTGEFIPGTEYVELEYIENTFGSFVNTGYIPLTTQNLDIDMKFEMVSVNPNAVNGMWGYMYSGQTNIPRLSCFYNPSEGGFGTGLNKTVYFDNSLTIGDIYEAHLLNGIFILTSNDTSGVVNIGKASTGQTTYPIYFGARCNESGKPTWASHLKIYSFKITDGDGPVCDMIPVKRTSDDVIGFYDKVTDTFFTNAGTGEFIAGPEK